MTPVQPNQIFQATHRIEPWLASDYFTLAAKIVFFPITALYYAVQYCLSCIAYPIGVTGFGHSREVDSQCYQELVTTYSGQRVEFITEDGVELEGMHFQNPHASPNAKTVLVCSGSAASYECNAGPVVDAIYRMGHNVMLFNYRGFGHSKGTPSQRGFYLDAEAAYQYLKLVKGLADEQMVAMGYSMGSAPATDLAAHHRIPLFLDRYFSSMHDVAYDAAYRKLGTICALIAKLIFYFGDADFDLKEKIKAVEGRIFLARANADNIMQPYHEEYLRGSLAGRVNVESITADSGHIHYGTRRGTQDLWFHPENPPNSSCRRQLELFLNA